MTISNPLHAHASSISLHRYWDDLPAPPWLNGSRLHSTVIALISRHPAPAATGTPEQWIDESWQIASEHAYPPEVDAVPTITADFHNQALTIANRRVTEAGYRLAALLRQLLR